jgi:hypothetical protein
MSRITRDYTTCVKTAAARTFAEMLTQLVGWPTR